MCYDVSFTVDIKLLSDYFPDLIEDDQLKINFDATIHIVGHAYPEHPVIYQNREDGKLHLKLMEWGCIPFYVKEEAKFLRQRASMLNARSERILDDKTSYWHKIRERRCLIPVTGIYEHREIKGWKYKVPYFIKCKQEPLFFLPGLYSVAELPDPETGELIKRFSYTIVTRPANTVMRAIHNGGDNAGRMPLFLPFELAKEWLSELTGERYRQLLNFEMPDAQLDYWPVFTIRGTKPHPENKRKNEPYDWPKLPELEIG